MLIHLSIHIMCLLCTYDENRELLRRNPPGRLPSSATALQQPSTNRGYGDRIPEAHSCSRTKTCSKRHVCMVVSSGLLPCWYYTSPCFGYWQPPSTLSFHVIKKPYLHPPSHTVVNSFAQSGSLHCCRRPEAPELPTDPAAPAFPDYPRENTRARVGQGLGASFGCLGLTWIAKVLKERPKAFQNCQKIAQKGMVYVLLKSR